MLRAIRRFFDDLLPQAASSGEVSEHALRLATAALLLEMARMDDEIEEDERRAVYESVSRKFCLSEGEAAELIALAEEEAKEHTDYYQFTSLINKGFTPEQKVKVVEHLWQVAYADGLIDKYEEHMVRKIAELLYVPHSDFIAAKLRTLARRKRRH